MRPKKSLGQNFLMHAQIAERIVDVAGVGSADTVLEVGPGTGKLMRALLQKVGNVIAVETDAELLPQLHETFAREIGAGTLRVEHADIRTYNFAELPKKYHVVANIPYYITGEIIRLFLSAPHKPLSMTLLVQKEVAERVARNTKESLLSLSVKAYGTPRYQFTVSRGAFMPAPNVDSAVLTISNIGNPFSTKEKEQWFFDVLHAGFAHKRKLLVRNLEAVSAPHDIASAFSSLLIPPKTRAEDVSLASWVQLCETLTPRTV